MCAASRHDDCARDEEVAAVAFPERGGPHEVPPRGEPLERRPPLRVGSELRDRQRRERPRVLEQDRKVRRRRARFVDEVDLKSGAPLNNDRASVDERVGAVDNDVRQPRLRVERHVECEDGRAARQRADDRGAGAVALLRDAVAARDVADQRAVRVERLAAQLRRRDRVALRRHESDAKVRREVETDHRQPDRARRRNGCAKRVRRQAGNAHRDSNRTAANGHEPETAVRLDGSRRRSNDRLNDDGAARHGRAVRAQHVADDADLIIGALPQRRGRQKREQQEQ